MKYIKEDYLKKRLKYYKEHNFGAEAYAYQKIIDEINNAPSSETKDIEISSWEPFGVPVSVDTVAGPQIHEHKFYRCKSCKRGYYVIFDTTPYCPECGAYMNGIYGTRLLKYE